MRRTEISINARGAQKLLKMLWRVLPHAVFRQTHFLEFVKVLETKKVQKLLDVRPGEIILDVACGIGLQSSKMSMCGSSVIGLDIVRDKIYVSKWMNANSDLQLLIADGTMLPFRSGSFDKIACVCALEHIKKDQEAIAEMNRTAKRNAILVLSVDSFTFAKNDFIQSIHRRANSVAQYYDLPTLRNKLERSGFKIEKAEFYGNSQLSAFFFKIEVLCPIMSRLLFPLSLTLSVTAERFVGRRDRGYGLCVKAKKTMD